LTLLVGLTGFPVHPSAKDPASMNKNELIVAVASRTGLSKATATQAVEATFESIVDALKAGIEVKIVGFGNFVVTERAPSEGRNPRTGEAMQIGPVKTPKFRAGKVLKETVNP
jgi:DNA-binding protein HU-beta